MELARRLRLFIAIISLTLVVGTTGCFAAPQTIVSSEQASEVKVVQPSEPIKDKNHLNQELSEANTQSSATSNGIKISVTSGINGLAKIDEWLPVTVIIENSGELVKGHVTVRRPMVDNPSSIYQQEVDLGRGAKKRLLFNTRLDDFGSGNVPVEAAFISNNKLLVKATSRYTGLAPDHQIIIALTDDGANCQFFKDLTADKPTLKISYMDQRDLPFRDNTLASASFMVISGASTASLTKEQKAVLSNWVASGGRLIICGGTGWKKSIAGLPKEILPVQPSAVETLNDFGPIENFIGKTVRDVPTTPIPIASASEIQGKVIAGDKSNPLVVTRDFGFGKVTWVALDLTMEPFTSWRENPAFWNQITQAQPTAQKTAEMGFSGDPMGMQTAISNIPALQLPSLRWLIPFILLYIVLIGPANYLILKRKDRKELAWVTIPVIILFFSLSSFVYAYGKKGGYSGQPDQRC
ncbi:MAG: hypothetical protein IBX64_09710 [Actinobacteria bacterium]|nr:hypothetical protein [Actinomycetota bacterium]